MRNSVTMMMAEIPIRLSSTRPTPYGEEPFAGGEYPPPPPPEEKVHCNAGNGNGNEGCDPGNSAPQGRGGDEIGAPVDEGGSQRNPGGNNVRA